MLIISKLSIIIAKRQAKKIPKASPIRASSIVILKWNKNKALSLTKALAISNGVGKINLGKSPKFPQTCQTAIKIIMLIKTYVSV